MTGFYPFGPPVGGEPGKPPPPRGMRLGRIDGPPPDEVVAMMRQQGVIPPFVRDEDIMIAGITPSGEMRFLGSAADAAVARAEELAWDDCMQWHTGEPLPHTARDFSDPPFGETPDEWRDKLIRLVKSVDDADEFRFGMMYYLGRDLIDSHGVPVDPAVEGAGEFADWVYDTFRKRGT